MGGREVWRPADPGRAEVVGRAGTPVVPGAAGVVGRVGNPRSLGGYGRFRVMVPWSPWSDLYLALKVTLVAAPSTE